MCALCYSSLGCVPVASAGMALYLLSRPHPLCLLPCLAQVMVQTMVRHSMQWCPHVGCSFSSTTGTRQWSHGMNLLYFFHLHASLCCVAGMGLRQPLCSQSFVAPGAHSFEGIRSRLAGFSHPDLSASTSTLTCRSNGFRSRCRGRFFRSRDIPLSRRCNASLSLLSGRIWRSCIASLSRWYVAQ